MDTINRTNNYVKIILIAIVGILLFIVIGVYELYVIGQYDQYSQLIEEAYYTEKALYRFRESFQEFQLEIKNELVAGNSLEEKEFIRVKYEELNAMLRSFNYLLITDREYSDLQLLQNNLVSYYNVYAYHESLYMDSNSYSDLRLKGNNVLVNVENLMEENSKEIKELSLFLDKYYPSVKNNISLTVITFTIILASLASIAVFYTKEYDKKLFKFAYYDILSDISNRTYFMQLVSIALTKSKKRKLMKGFMLIDAHTVTWIDGTLGSKVGDEILKQIGERLRNKYDGPCIVGRLGGCVFMLLTPNVDCKNQISEMASSIINLINKPFMVEDYELSIDVNIGISLFPEQGLEAEELEKRAGNALVASAKIGKNTYQFFNESLEKELMTEMEIERKLKLALANEDFYLEYQPILNSRIDKVDFFEALIRWKDEDGKLISPLEFLPLAEKNGSISMIGNWVLRNACKQIVAWQHLGDDFSVSVNVSPVEFQDNNFVSQIKQILEETEVDPKHLILEITENIFIENFQLMERTIKEIKELGIRIALDDFGTGYSSLGYLRRLPIDLLKIDKIFVQCLSESKQSTIINEIISISHTLGLKVVAEGVEIEAQLNELRKMDVDYLQGFYIDRPQNAERIEADYLHKLKLSTCDN